MTFRYLKNQLSFSKIRILIIFYIMTIPSYSQEVVCDGFLSSSLSDKLLSNSKDFFETILAKCVIGLLPYDPIVVEVGGCEGKQSIFLASTYPKGRIFVFEPNPTAFEQLSLNTQALPNIERYNLAISDQNGKGLLYVTDSSQHEQDQARLLKNGSSKHFTSAIEVSCVSLLDWAKEKHIDYIDFLRLGVGGIEWKIFRSSLDLIKTARVIMVKTNQHSLHKNPLYFQHMQLKLENLGFRLLIRYSDKNGSGDSVFLNNEIFNAIYSP